MESRDTLREFSLLIINKGTEINIMYGYDLSKASPVFYVKASINGSQPSANKKTLDRVQRLGIDPINRLIGLIGCDETGVSTTFDDDMSLFLSDIIDGTVDIQRISEYLKIDSSDVKEMQKLRIAIERIQTMNLTGKSDRAIASYYMRFVGAYRLGYLMNVRETIQSLRKLFYKGVVINDVQYVVHMEGYLRDTHYPTYYKRDIDLIRASRIRIYQHILNKPYKAVKR